MCKQIYLRLEVYSQGLNGKATTTKSSSSYKIACLSEEVLLNEKFELLKKDKSKTIVSGNNSSKNVTNHSQIAQKNGQNNNSNNQIGRMRTTSMGRKRCWFVLFTSIGMSVNAGRITWSTSLVGNKIIWREIVPRLRRTR